MKHPLRIDEPPHTLPVSVEDVKLAIISRRQPSLFPKDQQEENLFVLEQQYSVVKNLWGFWEDFGPHFLNKLTTTKSLAGGTAITSFIVGGGMEGTCLDIFAPARMASDWEAFLTTCGYGRNANIDVPFSMFRGLRSSTFEKNTLLAYRVRLHEVDEEDTPLAALLRVPNSEWIFLHHMLASLNIAQ